MEHPLSVLPLDTARLLFGFDYILKLVLFNLIFLMKRYKLENMKIKISYLFLIGFIFVLSHVFPSSLPTDEM